MPALPVVVMSGKTGQRFKVLLSSDANSLMLTEGKFRYNKAGNYPALLWNKAVPNSTFRPMVDIATLISEVGRQAPCCASFEFYVARPEGADISR
ncbi:hypothetical protein AXK30_22115 [Escherichia coli]|nr:hypothetical protein AXK30_22115 [Escherichia coli]